MAKKAKIKAAKPTSQSFAIHAPAAVTVQLAGDFTHWQEKPISLKKEAGGIWRTEVELPPGTHHYRFIVDGSWTDDPDCTVRVPNSYGSENMVRTVG